MTGSVSARNASRVTTGSLYGSTRHEPARAEPGHGRRRAIAVLAVLVVAAVAVLLLVSAGFDPRVAAASIGVLTLDVFASWFLIARANRGKLLRRPIDGSARRR